MPELWVHNARNQEIEKSYCCSCKWWEYLFLHERDSLAGLVPNLAMSRIVKVYRQKGPLFNAARQ